MEKRIVGIIRYEKKPDFNRDGSDEFEDKLIHEFQRAEDSYKIWHTLEDCNKYGVSYKLIEYNERFSYNSIGGEPEVLSTIDKGEIVWLK